MTQKAFAILALLAAAVVLLAILSQRGGDSGPIAGASAGSPLLPALAPKVGSIARIDIEAAGRAPVVRLMRDGDTWTVVDLGGYPAEPRQVGALLLALAEARVIEEKTANPAFHSRLGVESVDTADASGLEVTLTAADGDRFAVVLGEPYGNGQRYARLAGEDLSYLIDRDPEIARMAADWVAPEIIAIEPSRIQSVEIAHADGERLVIRKSTPADTNFSVDAIPEGRELQYAGVANVTGSVLQNLRLDDVAALPSERPAPTATVEFRTFDGLVVTVTAVAADNEDPWLTFTARFDAGQALAFATEPVDNVAGEPAPGPDVLAEAEAINARLAGWQYRIPSFQLSQMTRRMDDLLRAPPSADE